MNVINAIAWVKCTVVIRILIFDKAWTRNDSWHYIPLYESNLRVFFFLYTWEICQKCWPQKWKSSNWKVAVFQIGFRNCRINSIIELILMLYLNIQTKSFVLTFFLAPALCDQLNGLESLPSTQQQCDGHTKLGKLIQLGSHSFVRFPPFRMRSITLKALGALKAQIFPKTICNFPFFKWNISNSFYLFFTKKKRFYRYSSLRSCVLKMWNIWLVNY